MRVRGGDCRCGFMVKEGSKELVIGLRRAGAKEAVGGGGDLEQPSSGRNVHGRPRWAQDARGLQRKEVAFHSADSGKTRGF